MTNTDASKLDNAKLINAQLENKSRCLETRQNEKYKKLKLRLQPFLLEQRWQKLNHKHLVVIKLLATTDL